MLDAIIVGGGPAGLSAALILGRANRRVLLCDSGEKRNAASHALHGFLTRDGIAPAELLRLARRELRRYDSVELRAAHVADAEPVDGGFEVCLDGGERLRSRTLLLATGVLDRLPDLPGAKELYGRGVFHCPYCDGWEYRDAALGVYGRGKRGLGLALELTQWSRDILLCTDGPSRLSPENLARLVRNGVTVRTERILRLEGRGVLERISFAGGEAVPCAALFFNTAQVQHSELPARLGCAMTSTGAIRPGKLQSTSVPNVYVAGDASRDVQLTIVAAAEGARAAFAINTALLRRDLA